MKSFKQFWTESQKKKQKVAELVQIFEHEVYKRIQGTKNSYRTDPGNTNTMTVKHSHVYAKPKGGGRELYSVNVDGSGHDGSSGTEIPTVHADYFRSMGYTIKPSNILESLELENIDNNSFTLVLLEIV